MAARARASKLHPFLEWLRAAGIGAELFGWGALMLSDLYWPAVCIIFVGFALLALDLLVEPRLTASVWRIVGALAIAGFAFAFGRWSVWVSAPLEITAFWDDLDYSPGAEIDGVKWKDGMSRLTIHIKNPSSHDYERLDLNLKMSEAVIALRQETSVPCTQLTTPIDDIAYGHPIFTMGDFRYRCDKLPDGATIAFVAIIRNAEPTQRWLERLGRHDKQAPEHSPKPLYGPKRKPARLYVTVSYALNYRPHRIASPVRIASFHDADFRKPSQ